MIISRITGFICLLFIIIWSLNRCTKPESGVVSTATPEATEAGAIILNKGGNAIDAAVAVSFALAVTEPAMSGLGGGTQMLVGPKDQDPFLINGTTFSPKATPEAIDKDSITYHRRSTIPSTVKTLYFAWKNYGSGNVSWKECISPSIELAKEGFIVGPFRYKVYKRYANQLLNSPYHTSHLLIDGRIPMEGEVLRQPAFAHTLEKISDKGGDEFYQGEIARIMADDFENYGGWITYQDLYDFPDPLVLKALHTEFNGYDVYTAPPPCGGWTLLLALNLFSVLEPSGNHTLEESIIQSLKMAHLDRKNNPVTDLRDYQSEIDAKFNTSYARQLLQYKDETTRIEENDSGETTHFSIVDREGNVVAVTASINAYFGARAASEELGFLYNTYMDDFTYDDPKHPFTIGPGKMAYSSMTPTILKKDGKNVMAIGSPGSARIISAVFQIISRWVHSDESIKDIVEMPRIHVNHPNLYMESPQDTSIHDSIAETLNLQFTSVRSDLSINGLNAYFGGIHCVAFEKGRWLGVADPRRDGSVSLIQ